MFKILTRLPPPPPPSLGILCHCLARHTGGEFVMFPFVPVPRKHQDGGQGASRLTCPCPLFNLTRQAALGTFQSIFKLTIYNQFSKGAGEGAAESKQPCVVVEGVALGVGR